MRNFQFDPFGEALQSGASAHPQAGPASKVALRLGVGLFWSLVAVIIAARVVFFNPDFAKTFGTIAANCFRGLFHI
jgi:hypothetical protein